MFTIVCNVWRTKTKVDCYIGPIYVVLHVGQRNKEEYRGLLHTMLENKSDKGYLRRNPPKTNKH